MSEYLVHLGHVFINFENGSFQWVDIQRFRLPGPTADDESALAMLISHELYGDDHAGSEDVISEYIELETAVEFGPVLDRVADLLTNAT